MLTTRVLSMVIDELKREGAQQQVRKHLVDPLIKMLHAHLMPYLLVLVVVVVAILLMSMMTLTLSALFYFKRAAPAGI